MHAALLNDDPIPSSKCWLPKGFGSSWMALCLLSSGVSLLFKVDVGLLVSMGSLVVDAMLACSRCVAVWAMLLWDLDGFDVVFILSKANARCMCGSLARMGCDFSPPLRLCTNPRRWTFKWHSLQRVWGSGFSSPSRSRMNFSTFFPHPLPAHRRS